METLNVAAAFKERLEQLEQLKQLEKAKQTPSETWPKDVQLYQPPEDKQMLLPEQASCLAVKTYLRMCQLPYSEQSCANAEFMSPGGRLTKLPLLRVGKKLLTEFEPIVAHVESTELGQGLSGWLEEEERQDMRCLVTYTESTCTLTELHQCFLESQIYASHTLPRSGAAHPWPLNTLRRMDRRQDALRLLRVYQWQGLDGKAALEQLQQCCRLLSDQLMEQELLLTGPYLYGRRVCELDALVFGHVAAILCTELPSPLLAETLREFPNLIAHSRRIDMEYHGGKQLAGLNFD